MKNWTNPEFEVLDITATANGKNNNKFEGIDGVDAHGAYNSYINKNGTGRFVVNSDNQIDVVDEQS